MPKSARQVALKVANIIGGLIFPHIKSRNLKARQLSVKAALVRADKHCDLSGLPPATAFARSLDDSLISGQLSVEEAIAQLIDYHKFF